MRRFFSGCTVPLPLLEKLILKGRKYLNKVLINANMHEVIIIQPASLSCDHHSGSMQAASACA